MTDPSTTQVASQTLSRQGLHAATPSDYLAACALVAATSLLCEQVRPYLSPINMVMAYLLAVVLAAVRLGLKPAILSAFLGVLAFDFFFVPPRFSLRTSDTEYLITFLALFIVGVVISSLVTRGREGAEALRLREIHTASLYRLSRDLAAATGRPALLATVVKNIEESLNAQLAVFLPEEDRLEVAASSRGLALSATDQEIAFWSFRSRRLAGRGTDSYASSSFLFIPLKALAQTLGVLCIKPEGHPEPETGQLRRLVDSYATQISMALERLHLADQAQQAEIHQARESLERALLNSISHDLRTPLVTITGVLSAVLEEVEHLDPSKTRELLETAVGEAGRLNRFVGNLLDMTRLEAGAVQLRLEPCDVQDLIGCALAPLEKQLSGRKIVVRLPPDLPLVTLDLVLMIQVLVNLIENAHKYSAPEKEIEIFSTIDETELSLRIADRGPGVPEAELGRVFDKFYRIPVPEGVSGTGLGLSICKGIVEAHGGLIGARNRAGGGLEMILTVPIQAISQERADVY
jgi:two-component system, OmpR family, sensor histidine kinase KdpD